MRFIHVADVHLGATPDAGSNWADERAREIWEGFDDLLVRAYEQAVDFILIAGDLFHRQPLLRELKELNYKFEKIKPVRIVIMAGNHDYMRADSYYHRMTWAENVYFFKKPKVECFCFDDKQTYIYGMSYEHFEVEEAVYDSLQPVAEEGCHILLAHGGDAKHCPIKFDRLASAGFDYVAMGHIHKPEIMYDGQMAYAGALQPIDKNDIGEHGYIYGEWTGESCKIEFIPFSKRQYIPIGVRMDGTMPWSMLLDMISAQIDSYGNQHIYKVELTGFRDPDIEVSPDDICRLGNVVDVTDNTRLDYDFDEIYVRNKDNIIGMFIERMRTIPAEETSREKALYYGLKALFQTME